jgi:hypothetical protein
MIGERCHAAGSARFGRGSQGAFYAATLEALCQSLLDAATLAEMRVDRPTSDLLVQVLREIDRGLWQKAAQESVQVYRLLSVYGAVAG